MVKDLVRLSLEWTSLISRKEKRYNRVYLIFQVRTLRGWGRWPQSLSRALGSGLICSGPLSCGTCGENFPELLTKPKGYENRSYIYALYQQFPIPTFETSASWQWEDSGRKTNIVWRILLKAASRRKLGCYSKEPRASLVAQWLRICLLLQGTRVRALVWADPTCQGATGPVSHKYWACASGACAPQQERPR